MRSLTLALGLMMLSSPAFAYYSVMDTGEVMSSGRYKLTPEIQFITQGGGANVGTNFDIGINEEIGLRAQVGAGDTDFYFGGFFKFMPFPDTDSQPAIGFNAGLVYARDEGSNNFTIRFEPLISKRWGTEFGAIVPYASVPLGIQHRSADKYANDHNNLTAQIAVGTQVDLKTLPDVGLMAEVGFDLNHTASYVSFGGAWSFGAEKSSGKE